MSGTSRMLRVLGWVGVTLLAVLPLLVVVVQALSIRWFFPDVIPNEWTLDALGRVLTDSTTLGALVDSLVVGGAVTVLSLALAVPAARALTIGAGRHVPAMVLLFLVPIALPPVALAMGLNVAFLRVGFAGTIGTVVIAHLVATLPYTVLVLCAALTRYDAGYERQAVVLGASPARIILRVFVPGARGALAVTAVLTFIVSWGQYLLTFLPAGGRVTTLPVLVLASSTGGNPTGAAALALLAATPPALAILAVSRHLDAAWSASEARS